MSIKYNKIRECRYGTLLYNVNDMYVGKSLELYGEFSEGEIELFKQIIRKGYVVFDIGANIGTHTLFFAQVVGLEGEVYAFEPQRILFQTLCANMALNSIVNSYCYNLAVGKKLGSMLVPQMKPWLNFNFGGLSLLNQESGEKVKVISIDSLSLSRCHLIKIDVEGMEIDVLKGCRDTIKRFQPILYVENNLKENGKDLIQFIDSLGYDMYWHPTYLYNPNNLLKKTENVFGNYGSVNMLCLTHSHEYKIRGLEKVDAKT